MFSVVGFCDDTGKYAVDDPKGLAGYIREHFTGREFVLTVETRESARSRKANAYYWGVIIKSAVDETQQPAESVHAFWCDQFLPDERERVEFFHHMTGQRITAKVDPRRSSKLTGKAFYDFVEECRLWLQTFLGVTTPDPDPAYWRKRTVKGRAA